MSTFKSNYILTATPQISTPRKKEYKQTDRLFRIPVCVLVLQCRSAGVCVHELLGSIEEAAEKQRDPLLGILMHYQPTAPLQAAAAATKQRVESLYHMGTVQLYPP